MKVVKANKIIIRSKGEFEIPDTHSVYELNLSTGMILKADMVYEGEKNNKPIYRLIEKEDGRHIYAPADGKDAAKIKFNGILRSARK